jgi:myo-inositol catabolism protein IolC
MHLMRVLELGLHSLADQLGVSFQNANWQNIIDQIEKHIRTMSSATHGTNRKSDQQFYSEAAAHFRVLKDAWRNHSMHIHERYGEEKAEAIFNSVRAFMQHLATKLCEPARKAIS